MADFDEAARPQREMIFTLPDRVADCASPDVMAHW